MQRFTILNRNKQDYLKQFRLKLENFQKKKFIQKINKYSFNSSRYFLEEFVREASKSLPKGSLVLDAGAGDNPYKSFFSEVCYESADFCQVDKGYGKITYVCDLAAIPVEDNRYDLILLSQVLEHIPEPLKVLQEMQRILKPGGQLWLSAPLFYEEHETPYDFYRYTQFGFQYLLQSANLKVKKIEWLEGYFGTLSYQLKTASEALPERTEYYSNDLLGFASAIAIRFLKPLFFILSILFYALDVKKKYTGAGYCKNYAIVAVKEF